MIDDITPLRNAAEVKASRYGDLSAPYVISVDAHAPTTDDYDAERALYGTQAVQFWESAPVGSTQPTWVTLPDGLWHDRGGWRRQLVSAVVVTAGLLPWNLPRIVPTAWLHPYASFPMSGSLICSERHDGAANERSCPTTTPTFRPPTTSRLDPTGTGTDLGATFH
jgi:hypothetical protein